MPLRTKWTLLEKKKEIQFILTLEEPIVSLPLDLQHILVLFLLKLVFFLVVSFGIFVVSSGDLVHSSLGFLR